jgi:hypothetical protein
MEEYTVKEEPDGFRVYYRRSWGIGYTFIERGFAEAAARALNDNVALDQQAAKASFDAARKDA